MKLLPIVAATVLSVASANLLFCGTQAGEPAPTHVVHIPSVRTSTMSPDEKWLAVIVVHQPRGASPTAELQVWDFRANSLVQSRSLPVPEEPSQRWRPFTGDARVAYTSDGQLLAVQCGGDALRVLRASDLEEVRTIALLHPVSINAIEVSPTAHRVAIRMLGDLHVYDLDSGKRLRNWSVHPTEVKLWPLVRVTPRLDGPGLAWREDGRLLAISVADGMPCQRGGGTIYTFDVVWGEAAKTFRVPLLPVSIAFGAGNRLFVAYGTCGGYFAHWALDLPIFDSASGQEIGKIPSGKVGVRNYIAISANKQMLVAQADREKTTLAGLEDSLETRDEQWQVWNLATGKLVMTLPAGPEYTLRGAYANLSSSGHFLYAARPGEVLIYSAADGTK
jgi:WD40 repeat protein